MPRAMAECSIVMWQTAVNGFCVRLKRDGVTHRQRQVGREEGSMARPRPPATAASHRHTVSTIDQPRVNPTDRTSARRHVRIFARDQNVVVWSGELTLTEPIERCVDHFCPCLDHPLAADLPESAVVAGLLSPGWWHVRISNSWSMPCGR